LRAVQRVVEEKGFDMMLDQTRDRIDEIEGLDRQSELTVKEPFRVVIFDHAGMTPVIEVQGLGASFANPEEGKGDRGDLKGSEEGRGG
jgi:hypothetical protein